MSITTYATLKTEIADELNRSDLTASVSGFVQRCENRLRRDPRARRLQDRTLVVSADDTSLPSDYQSLDSLAHEGGTHFGPLFVVSMDEITYQRGRLNLGTTGVPRYAAVLQGKLRFAPVPDQSYTLRMSYWLKIEPLSDTNTTNWLLLDSPDIYFYGSLLESAPYLKHDERLVTWKTEYNERLEELHGATVNAQYGGGTVRRHFKAIG